MEGENGDGESQEYQGGGYSEYYGENGLGGEGDGRGRRGLGVGSRGRLGLGGGVGFEKLKKLDVQRGGRRRWRGNFCLHPLAQAGESGQAVRDDVRLTVDDAAVDDPAALRVGKTIEAREEGGFVSVREKMDLDGAGSGEITGVEGLNPVVAAQF
jgi:hypothetical protein